jgi:tetratricopeptide (TPR) repeat protein
MNNHFAVAEARAVLEAGAVQIGDLGEDAGAAALLAELARVYMFDDDSAKGLPLVDRALLVAERLELIEITADAMTTKGNLLVDLGRLRESIALQRGAAALAGANGHYAVQARALGNLTARLWGEDPRESWSVALEAVEVARRLGEAEWLLAAAEFTAGFGVNMGRWSESLALIDELDVPGIPSADHVALATTHMQILALSGDIEAAEAIYRELAPLRARLTRAEDLAAPIMDRALLEYCRGDFTSSIDSAFEVATTQSAQRFFSAWLAACGAFLIGDASSARKARDIADASPERGRMVQAYRESIRGGAAIMDGDIDGGLRDLRDSMRYMRLSGAQLDLLFNLINAAYILPADHPARAEMIDEARAIATGMGAVTLLRILDQASAPPTAPASTAASASAAAPGTAEQPTATPAG